MIELKEKIRGGKKLLNLREERGVPGRGDFIYLEEKIKSYKEMRNLGGKGAVTNDGKKSVRVIEKGTKKERKLVRRTDTTRPNPVSDQA